MITSLTRAIAQLPDPRFRRVLWSGLIGTVVLYGLLYLAVGWGLTGLRPFHIGWADTVTDLLGGLAIFVVTLLLFPSIATLLMSFLLETVAAAVEDKHFPALPPPRRQGLWESLWIALRFSGVAFVINLLALPVYLLLLFAGIGVGLYYIVNGYLLSRDYFEIVAGRRMGPRDADALRRRHRLRLWLLGIVLAVLSTLPVINLFAPLIATAAMVHEVEKLRTRGNEAS
ncbi:MAG TPA: EI24 domain-containing protein [Telmatospirillum sp.]|nr:EI24 domain-containing protein [Telmatospirillum sp.]